MKQVLLNRGSYGIIHLLNSIYELKDSNTRDVQSMYNMNKHNDLIIEPVIYQKI